MVDMASKVTRGQVSVIITTYRNENYLSRAIDSVLCQSYANIQLIVVDDNHPDSDSRRATEEVMSCYPNVTYLKHPRNMNGAVARNTGIRSATGEYIAFLDNDDIYFSNHIESCVEALEQNSKHDCVLCGVVKVCRGMCWDIIVPSSGDMVKTLFLSETALGTGSNLFARSEAVREVNGFDESFLRHQDVEFGIRLFANHAVHFIEEIQIIKEMDGESNAPDFQRFLEIKKQFINKFQTQIDAMSVQEQKSFYAAQYSALLYVACKNRNVEQRRWSVQELKKYRILNKKERILVVLSACGLFELYEKIKTAIKIKRTRRIKALVVRNLEDKDLQILSSMGKG